MTGVSSPNRSIPDANCWYIQARTGGSYKRESLVHIIASVWYIINREVTPPERDIQGAALDAGTGLSGAHLRGMHLRMPGCGDEGPTLEIFRYSSLENRQKTAVNRPGYGHIAFEVEDVPEARARVLAVGGQPVGDIVALQTSTGASVTWCYVTDPEGNVIELQSWSGRAGLY